MTDQGTSTEPLSWAAPAPSAPSGRPNVVVIVLDDMGFGHLGCFGSEIDTPACDALADGGLRYNRFHVTAMCSPTRASLLTGRNHHAVGMGLLPDLPLREAGYTGRIPPTAAALPRLLRDAGYSTYAVGKWHLTPRDERSPSGPFDLWPLGVGFERYYGFLHGDANHWTPLLVRDNHLTEPPAGPEDGYHLTEDLADQAIRMLLDQHHATPGKPFFLYFGLGAVHAPHHVAAEWADAYRGRFDDGWEATRDRTIRRQLELGVVPPGTEPSERPPWVQPWDDLPAEHRRAFARQQEVFAGFLTHTDAQIGRILAHLEQTGRLDDTVVILISDNGASAEGGRIGSTNEHRFGFTIPETIDEVLDGTDDLGGFRSYNHYAWGWAWAGNAPFRLWKRYTWLGGTRVPMIVRGPVGAPDAGTVRDPLCHVVDLFPTVLELCGVEAPDEVDGIAQQPVDGASLVETLRDPEAGAPRSTQYFELLGSRSIYHGRWKATTDHVSSGVLDEDAHLVGSRDFDEDHWALFDLDADFAEAHDVSDAHPDVVADLAARWDAEAERNGVLPMEDSLQGRIPSVAPPRHPVPTAMRYLPGGTPVGWESVVSLGGGGRMVASVEVPEAGAEGVLASMGDWSNGWALLVLDGRLAYLLSAVGERFRLDATAPLTPGAHDLGFEHHLGADGSVGRLLVDDEVVAEAPLPPAFGWANLQIGANGLCVGRGRGFPVIDVYRPPFPWTGEIHHLDIAASGGWFLGPDEELGAAVHRE
jgi:arylsulfatase A-like enzyme